MVRALSLVCHAVILGQSPSDPICVYQDTTDNMVYLTGAAIIEYFRYVTKLVYPDIDTAALAFISSSLRACFAQTLSRLLVRVTRFGSIAVVQVIWYSKDVANPSFCPVVHALSLVRHAVILGQSPSDPICVYRDTTGNTVYLTGAAITKYFQYDTKLVYPDIDTAALASISSHSLRVTACVLLAEAGMPVYLLNYAYIGSAIV